jgi:6-phosphogluconolactonase
VADLGTDKLVSYSLSNEGQLATVSELAMQARSGPRHMAFHPGGRWIFVMNELNSSVSVIERRDNGLALLESLSALPDDFSATSHGADIHVSPDGRFVYASNRGHDSIAIFAVDAGSGRLRPLGHSPSGGATPRNFALTSSGRHVLVANQDSDNIRVFSRDAESGLLTDTGTEIVVGTPLCVKVVEF